MKEASEMKFTAAHWGIYQIEGSAAEPVLKAFERDSDPSPIGLSALQASRARTRVHRPAVRRSWIEHGVGARPERRGIDSFVEVSWDSALDMAAQALGNVISEHGNASVFGGSYGWASAGRFHHAQSQVHRFLNTLGGYVRHTDSYSLGAANVLMPHLVAPMDELMPRHTSWEQLAAHTRLFVSFGGVPAKNTQVSPGLVGQHTVKRGLGDMAKAGVRFINVSPVRDSFDLPCEWIPIRPNTDTAVLLALAHTLYVEGMHDQAFLALHCTGFERLVPYLIGASDGVPKTPEWAATISEVPAVRIRALARELATCRTMLNAAWSLQRSHHGEQPYWALLTVACMLGQIGLPGGGFGVGYGGANMIGTVAMDGINWRTGGPTLPQGKNLVAATIPVARIADMLEKPGQTFRYNGRALNYPEIELIYWAGGNPFHHHQDLNRLLAAWRRPTAVLINEQFWTSTAKAADIVFPVTTTLERDDIGYSSSERYAVAMRRVMAPVGQARDDFDIFAGLATRLGKAQQFTEGRSSAQWLRHLYEDWQRRARANELLLPDFDTFWKDGLIDLARRNKPHVMLEDFRTDPVTAQYALRTHRDLQRSDRSLPVR